VLYEHYNRENNAVVEFHVPHQSITAFLLLRKSVPHTVQIRQPAGPEVLN
jgi:hypothetical protein